MITVENDGWTSGISLVLPSHSLRLLATFLDYRVFFFCPKFGWAHRIMVPGRMPGIQGSCKSYTPKRFAYVHPQQGCDSIFFTSQGWWQIPRDGSNISESWQSYACLRCKGISYFILFETSFCVLKLLFQNKDRKSARLRQRLGGHWALSCWARQILIAWFIPRWIR